MEKEVKIQLIETIRIFNLYSIRFWNKVGCLILVHIILIGNFVKKEKELQIIIDKNS